MQSSKKPSERRRSPRVSWGPPSCVTLYKGPSDSHKMILTDISAEGLRLEGGAQLRIGTSYPVSITLPDDTVIPAVAKILWIRPNAYIQAYGTRLAGISWWDRRKLNKHLRNSSGRASNGYSYWKIALVVALGLVSYKGIFYLFSLGWPALIPVLLIIFLYYLFVRYVRL